VRWAHHRFPDAAREFGPDVEDPRAGHDRAGWHGRGSTGRADTRGSGGCLVLAPSGRRDL